MVRGRKATLLLAVAVLAAVLVLPAAPAGAETVINGCTIGDQPPGGGPAPYVTVCPGADLSGLDLTGLQLQNSDFAGANFSGSDLSGLALFNMNLTGANLRGADLSDTFIIGAVLQDASLRGADLTNAELPEEAIFNADLTGANLTGASFPSAFVDGANFSRTLLVPGDQVVTATDPSGAVVSWPTPPSLVGAVPGTCDHASGSVFPVGVTRVTCRVDFEGWPGGFGTFRVAVKAGRSSQ